MSVLKAVRKAQRASTSLSDQEARFSPTVLSKILFKPGLETSTCPLMIARGVSNLAKRDFKNLQTTQERPHEIDATYVENLTNLDGILRHFTPLRNFSLTLTSVTRFDQVMGISIDCGPIKTKVKHILGGVVRAMMSLSRSIVASLKNFNDFLAVNTPSYDLIRIDFKQEGVVPKVMLHIFEEFFLLLGRHPFNNKVPRMVV
nr:hypothetical protein [Tanacetum cinerariifolium]